MENLGRRSELGGRTGRRRGRGSDAGGRGSRETEIVVVTGESKRGRRPVGRSVGFHASAHHPCTARIMEQSRRRGSRERGGIPGPQRRPLAGAVAPHARVRSVEPDPFEEGAGPRIAVGLEKKKHEHAGRLAPVQSSLQNHHFRQRQERRRVNHHNQRSAPQFLNQWRRRRGEVGRRVRGVRPHRPVATARVDHACPAPRHGLSLRLASHSRQV